MKPMEFLHAALFSLFFLWICLPIASSLHAEDKPSAPVKQFSQPDRIRYDGDCFQIEGKDTFIYSAAFHYYRTPKELWRDRLTKIKAAGFNTIETYVPMFTCMTNECRGSQNIDLSQVFDSDNYYIGHNQAGDCAHRMATLKKKQPDAPGLVCELQGGWFSTIGGGLSEGHHSGADHYQAINIMSMLGGATCLNPYMFVGGTHFAGWGARGQTTSYDYNAAIRENGAVGDKYLAAKAIGQLIHEHEAALVRAHGGPCEVENAPKSLTGGVRVAPDGTRFVFFHNADSKETIQGKYTLKPGANTIELVYENIGHEHGYVPMEELTGIDVAGLSSDPKSIQKPLSMKVALDLGGVQAGWTKAGYTPKSSDGWKRVSLDTTVKIPRKGRDIHPKNATQDGLLTWYRLEFKLPKADASAWVPWLLRINASGNGYMWLNGHNIGRHYQHGQQRDFYLPECWLNFGPGQKNTLMLGLRQTSHGANLKAAEILPYPDSAEVRK